MTLILLVGVPPEIGSWLEARLPGLKTQVLQTAAQVIAMLEREACHLIMVDHTLAEQTGLELLQQVRDAVGKLPPIFYSLPDLRDFALSFRLTQEFKVKRLLVHPLDPDELILRMRDTLHLAPATQPPPQIQGRLKELWAKHSNGLLTQAKALATLTEDDLEDEDKRAYLVKCAHQLAGTVATFGFPRASEMARLVEHSLLDGNPPAESVRAQGAAIQQMLQGTDKMLAPAAGELWDERLSLLQSLAVDLLGGTLSGEQLRTGLAEARKLRVAASLFRLPALLGAAAAVEELLMQSSPGREVAGQLAELVLTMQKEVARRGGLMKPSLGRKVHLCGEADLVQQDLALTFRLQGFDVSYGTLQDFAQVALTTLVVMEFRPEVSKDFYKALGELQQRGQSVIVYGEDATTGVRLRGSELGVKAFFDKPLDLTELVDFVKSLFRMDQQGVRLLAVDDDPALLGILSVALGEAGYQFTGEREPLLFWQRLEEVNPDLLILDLEMPHVSGIELCKVVRSHPRYGSLPIVFLTGVRDAEVVESLFRAGADDYVLKPVVGNELLRRIQDRLQRFLRSWNAVQAGRQGTAQLAQARVESLFQMAERFQQTLSLALIRETEDAESARLERRLRETLQPGDLLARWDARTRLIGWLGLDRQTAQHRLEKLVSGSDAVASDLLCLPADGDLESGLHKLEQSLLGGAQARTTRFVREVVLIDDDPRILDLVKLTLEMEGLTVRWLNSLGQAHAWMKNQPAEPVHQVILLDVQLGDSSGYELLKQMAEQGILKHNRVIMLTGEANPQQKVFKAIEAGAFDYLAKPFEPWVLLSRVRLARSQS
jgi:DNA-binding response OmpR family regulator